jgi:hypothetical protein
MKVKLDENLPASLAPILESFQHDIHTLADEDLTGHSDREVRDAAQREERFFVTQDLDFPISASLCREGITAFFWFVFETRTGTASFFASTKYSGERKWGHGADVS